MKIFYHICLVILGVACLALATSSPPRQVQTVGCDLVASPQGVDSADGSPDKPFASVQKLANTLQAGQTGCLRAGAYQDGGDVYVLNPPRAGGAESPITIRSYPGEHARLVGIVKIDVDNITLSGLDIEGTGEQNTVKIYAKNTVIENNDITNRSRGGSCMMVGTNSEAGAATGTLIRRNILHDCGSAKNTEARDHAIYTAHMVNGEIVDNLIYNPAAYAITLYPNASGNRVAHNVIDGASPLKRGGIVFGSDSSYSSSKNIVEHNIIAYPETYGITTAWGGPAGSGNIARKNCIWQAKSGSVSEQDGFTATDNRSLDPGFINRKARDYRLSPGSPCLDLVKYDTAARLMGEEAPVMQPQSLSIKFTSIKVLRPAARARKAMIRLQGSIANYRRATRKRVRISVKINRRWRVLAKTSFNQAGEFRLNRRIKITPGQSRLRIVARAVGRRTGVLVPVTVKQPSLLDDPDPSDPSDPSDPPRPDGLVWENGFENGLSGWNTAGVGDVDPSTSTDIVHSGQRSGRVVLNGSQDRSELIMGGRGDGDFSDTRTYAKGG